MSSPQQADQPTPERIAEAVERLSKAVAHQAVLRTKGYSSTVCGDLEDVAAILVALEASRKEAATAPDLVERLIARARTVRATSINTAELLREAASALASPPTAPEGDWVLVPREPGPCMGGSDDMLFAFVSALHANINDGAGPSGWHDFSDEQRKRLQAAYRAMIAAAPPPPQSTAEHMRDVYRDIAIQLGACPKCAGLHDKGPCAPPRAETSPHKMIG